MGLEPSSYDRTMLDKAFRKMSLQLHPDKNQSDPKATENFQHLGNCYLRLQRKLAGHGGDDVDDDDDEGDWGSNDDDYDVYVNTEFQSDAALPANERPTAATLLCGDGHMKVVSKLCNGHSKVCGNVVEPFAVPIARRSYS